MHALRSPQTALDPSTHRALARAERTGQREASLLRGQTNNRAQARRAAHSGTAVSSGVLEMRAQTPGTPMSKRVFPLCVAAGALLIALGWELVAGAHGTASAKKPSADWG